MRGTIVTTTGTLAAFCLAGWVAGVWAAQNAKLTATTHEPTADQVTYFEQQVRPLLEQHCFKCHGVESTKSEFNMLTRAGLIKGGEIGRGIDFADPDKSLLLDMISYRDGDHEMPPKGKLKDAEIEVLTKWVRMGAPWTPGDKTVLEGAPAPAAGQAHGDMVITDQDRNWWAYRKLTRPVTPTVKDAAWVRNPIDAFILSKLEGKGLKPVAPADKVALIRRAYYDLIGLPPTPPQVDAFVADESPDAYEKLIDALLASPQYGEKWGRHWLDLVRWAESNGYERDSTKPFAWRYRDYVIRSFNEDKPYDQFIREQTAGDELEEVTADSIIATGFYRLGIWNDEPADRLLSKYDVLDDILSTTGQAVMAMSIGCARCHSHKKDPIPQEDYYRMLAFFQDVSDMDTNNIVMPLPATGTAAARADLLAKQDAIHEQLHDIERSFVAQLAVQPLGADADSVALSDMVTLSYRLYRDTWSELPPFERHRHETAGEIAHRFFTLSVATRKDAIGLVFEGRLRVPADGRYTFHLDTKDGSRLTVDGRVVDEQAGLGRRQRDATAVLKRGIVPIRFEYFNATGEPVMNLSWSGPNFDRRPLTDPTPAADPVTLVSDSIQSGQVWQYTFTKPGDEWMMPGYNAADWRQGRGGFGRRGTPGAVVRTPWHEGDIWLRKAFHIERMPAGLALNLHHDEDVEVYLNGKLVTKLTGFKVGYHRIPLDAEAVAALQPGDNVIAVHCRHTGGGQYIDAGLMDTADRLTVPTLLLSRGEQALGAEPVAKYAALRESLTALTAAAADPAEKQMAMAVFEQGREPTHVLLRGNPNLQGKRVEPGFPHVLGAPAPQMPDMPPDARTSGKRRAMADYLTSPDNPLTARVIANRLWQHHFGRGIVRTPNEFGKLGELPTHPELLDWLAAETIAQGWRLKAMHKLIMTSAAYRMSSRDDEKGLAADPNNDLFWRFDMRRLSAEEIRDSILQVNGRLNLKMGGPSFYPELPAEVIATSSKAADIYNTLWGRSPKDEQYRRSVYIFVRRSLLTPMLTTHDLADTDTTCAVRFATTVPTQSLTMLNSEAMADESAAFAQRLRKEAGDDPAQQVALALKLVTGRTPTPPQIDRGVGFIRSMIDDHGVGKEQALNYFCLMALNLNEFVYLD